jgi:predicted lipoprotein
MKIQIAIILTCFSLWGCEDFTQKNLELAQQSPKTSGADLLLGPSSKINSGDFELEKFIANTGVFIMEPLNEKLKDNINVLYRSTRQHCSTLDVLEDLSKDQLEKMREPLQESWKEAMMTFHQLNMMKFGPAADVESTVMDSIYTFDGAEKCRVDLSLLQLNLRDRLPRLDVINNYNVRGLDSLEPLFFADPDKSRCSRVNTRLQAWFEQPLFKKEKDVCRYSLHLLEDMNNKADQLARSWSARKGHYTEKMLNGNVGSMLEVTNSISQALFNLDIQIKDQKLSYPAGFDVRLDGVLTKCPDASCPEAREHPYSELGLQSLLTSLNGFKNLFMGISIEDQRNGFGLDDLLRDRGHEQIADAISSNLEQAITEVRRLESKTTMGELLKDIDPTKCQNSSSENRLEEACALVWDLRGITNLLKNEYLAALQELSAPRQSRGDND